MSHVFTHGSSQAVLRTGRRACYSPSTGGETRTPGEPGEQFHQKNIQMALSAADRSLCRAENQSPSVCSVPGVPVSQRHGAIPSRLFIPIKPHHRRAGLAGPGKAIIAPIQLS